MTGPWYSQTSPYQILFGGSPVPTTLVQSGVLRCFAPGEFHEDFPMKAFLDNQVLQPFIHKSGSICPLPKFKQQRDIYQQKAFKRQQQSPLIVFSLELWVD